MRGSLLTVVEHRELEDGGCCCDLGVRSCSNHGVYRAQIPGVGPLDSPLWFVAEAPASEEVERGEPLVGRAGKYFDRMLKEAGIRRESVRLENVVRCRAIHVTSGGRVTNANPTPQQVNRCFPRLDALIRKHRPKVLVAMGGPAFRALTGNALKAGMMTWLFEEPVYSRRFEAWIMPILHPSALMRMPTRGAEYVGCVDRMREARSLLGRCKRLIDLEVEVPRDEAEAVRLIEQVSGDFAFDVETAVDNGDLLGLGLSWEVGHGVYIPWRLFRNPVYVALRKLFRRRLTKVAHNLQFDRTVLESYGIPVGDRVFDTMLAARLLNENVPYGLKALEWMYLDRGGRADWIEPLKKRREWRHVPEPIMAEYCVEDAESTYRLYRRFERELAEDQDLRRLARKVVFPLVRVVEEMEQRGVWIDREKLDALREKCRTRSTDALAAMYEAAGHEFNPASTPQLHRVLYEELGAKRRYLKGRTTANKAALESLEADGYEVASYVLEWRRWQKILGTYVERTLTLLDGRGRAHYHYLIPGAETGRMSGDFQQWPRIREVRQLVAAPPGRLLVDADYEQAELVIAFWVCGEREMARRLLSGVDAHALTASLIFGVPVERVTREQRSVGKTINFAILYGMTVESMARRLKLFLMHEGEVVLDELGRPMLDVARALRYQEKFFEQAPGLRDWIEAERRRMDDELCTRTPLGRYRRVPHVVRSDPNEREAAYREGVNAIIQGTVPDCAAIAMRRIYDRRAGLDTFFVGSVHDSATQEAAESDAERVSVLTVEAMEESYPGLGIGLRADVSIVQNWWDDKEDE